MTGRSSRSPRVGAPHSLPRSWVDGCRCVVHRCAFDLGYERQPHTGHLHSIPTRLDPLHSRHDRKISPRKPQEIRDSPADPTAADSVQRPRVQTRFDPQQRWLRPRRILGHERDAQRSRSPGSDARSTERLRTCSVVLIVILRCHRECAVDGTVTAGQTAGQRATSPAALQTPRQTRQQAPPRGHRARQSDATSFTPKGSPVRSRDRPPKETLPTSREPVGLHPWSALRIGSLGAVHSLRMSEFAAIRALQLLNQFGFAHRLGIQILLG